MFPTDDDNGYPRVDLPSESTLTSVTSRQMERGLLAVSRLIVDTIKLPCTKSRSKAKTEVAIFGLVLNVR